MQLLEELNLQPGEQEALEQERNLLANVTTVKESLGQILEMFDGGEYNILAMLRQSEGLLDGLDGLQESEQLISRMESLRIEATDIKDTVETLDSRLEADPRRLEYVEERLSDIYDLQRKLSATATRHSSHCNRSSANVSIQSTIPTNGSSSMPQKRR